MEFPTMTILQTNKSRHQKSMPQPFHLVHTWSPGAHQKLGFTSIYDGNWIYTGMYLFLQIDRNEVLVFSPRQGKTVGCSKNFIFGSLESTRPNSPEWLLWAYLPWSKHGWISIGLSPCLLGTCISLSRIDVSKYVLLKRAWKDDMVSSVLKVVGGSL